MPARDRWPLLPRVAVFPCPEPMPWPTLLRRLCARLGGRSVPMCMAMTVISYLSSTWIPSQPSKQILPPQASSWLLAFRYPQQWVWQKA